MGGWLRKNHTVTHPDDNPANPPPSAIGRLLAEISWEGNARHYHDGGIGRENVLTTEVFSALDLLPRTRFLGQILTAARGADTARTRLIAGIETATVTILPGDIRPVLPSGKAAAWTVQPDATISTATDICLVEAKRLRPSTFQPQQLARLATTVRHLSASRAAFCLLVLAEDPPLPVRGHGRLALPDAIRLGDHKSGAPDPDRADELFAVITWDEIATLVASQSEHFTNADPAVESCITRLAGQITDSVDCHR